MDVKEIKGKTVGKIMQFSIPAVIAMVLTSFVTVADGFFMGRYAGDAGIAAVNLGLPIVYLYLGAGLMVSIGGVAIAGMTLGRILGGSARLNILIAKIFFFLFFDFFSFLSIFSFHNSPFFPLPI